MLLDIRNIYDGVPISPTYPPSGAIPDWTPVALTAGTTLSTNAISHNQGLVPSGGTTGNQNDGQQYVTPFVGKSQVLVLKVLTAPGSSSDGDITVNLQTDQDATLINTPTTLATLSISETATAGTYYVLEETPNLKFELYSGLQYVLPSGQTIGIAAWLMPKEGLDFIPNYQSGWVVLS